MSRWKEKSPQSSPYITAEGHRQLEQEYRKLWQTRDEVRQALAAAAVEGDRSENAEYIYRKKQLREIDHRIAYIQKRLPKLKIVTEIQEGDRVYFSAWVELKMDNGSLVKYRIVGPDELGNDGSWISVDSPLARALLGKKVNDEVTINTKSGSANYIIVSISY